MLGLRKLRTDAPCKPVQDGPDGLPEGRARRRSTDVNEQHRSGQIRTVARGVFGFVPPPMVWNAGGTHLLIFWARAVGA